MPSTSRFQLFLAATVIIASVAVAVAAVSTASLDAGVSKGDRLDIAPATASGSFEVTNPEPGLTVIARGA